MFNLQIVPPNNKEASVIKGLITPKILSGVCEERQDDFISFMSTDHEFDPADFEDFLEHLDECSACQKATEAALGALVNSVSSVAEVLCQAAIPPEVTEQDVAYSRIWGLGENSEEN